MSTRRQCSFKLQVLHRRLPGSPGILYAGARPGRNAPASSCLCRRSLLRSFSARFRSVLIELTLLREMREGLLGKL